MILKIGIQNVFIILINVLLFAQIITPLRAFSKTHIDK